MERPGEGHGHGVVGEEPNSEGGSKHVRSLLLLGMAGLVLMSFGFFLPNNVGAWAKAGLTLAGFAAILIAQHKLSART
jgi:hypothetical protein